MKRKPRLDADTVASLEALLKETNVSVTQSARLSLGVKYIQGLVEHYRDPDVTARRAQDVERTKRLRNKESAS